MAFSKTQLGGRTGVMARRIAAPGVSAFETVRPLDRGSDNLQRVARHLQPGPRVYLGSQQGRSDMREDRGRRDGSCESDHGRTHAEREGTGELAMTIRPRRTVIAESCSHPPCSQGSRRRRDSQAGAIRAPLGEQQPDGSTLNRLRAGIKSQTDYCCIKIVEIACPGGN